MTCSTSYLPARGPSLSRARPCSRQLGGVAVTAELRSGGGGAAGGPSGGRRGKAGRGKARAPGLFEVQDISPPKRSLGIHALPPSTHNGDEIEVAGASYVVQSVVMQFKLVRGKYERDHARLEVQHTGRYLYNMFLEDMYQRDSSYLSEEEDR